MRYWEGATDKDWAIVLAEFPLFAGLGKGRLRKLARQAQVVEYAPGDVVIAPDQRAEAFYVILGGVAQVGRGSAARALRTGDYFGELALIDGGARSATVFAANELQVMRLPRRLFLQLAERDPRISLRMLRDLGARFGRLEFEPARRWSVVGEPRESEPRRRDPPSRAWRRRRAPACRRASVD
jgi:CRP/FNR family transcriptional regulator, cyclic AMP receptor protein